MIDIINFLVVVFSDGGFTTQSLLGKVCKKYLQQFCFFLLKGDKKI